MHEEWKPITGYEGRYEVSNHGRVRSLDRFVYCRAGAYKRFVAGKILKPFKTARGEMQINLSDDYGPCPFVVHRLVGQEFKPRPSPAPRGACLMHRDGDKTNNRVDNLRWTTVGKRGHAAGMVNAKLSYKQVRNIKAKLRDGESMGSLAKQYGVSKSTIHRIKHNDSWAGVAPYSRGGSA